MIKSGNRSRQLAEITAPTLVIHGASDRLIHPSGGEATAEAIPNAELMLVEGMGHDFPRGAWPLLLDRIAAHAHSADRKAGVVTSESL